MNNRHYSTFWMFLKPCKCRSCPPLPTPMAIFAHISEVLQWVRIYRIGTSTQRHKGPDSSQPDRRHFNQGACTGSLSSLLESREGHGTARGLWGGWQCLHRSPVHSGHQRRSQQCPSPSFKPLSWMPCLILQGFYDPRNSSQNIKMGPQYCKSGGLGEVP